MSTEIKPGQVWAWNNGRPTVQILHVTGSLAFYRILPNGEDHYAVPLSTLAIEAHLVTDALALVAPLDKATVLVGDTVTVTVAALHDTPEFEITGKVYGGQEAIDRAVGDYMLMHGRLTLTAHQPAPRPVPEWKPGTSGTATINSVPDARVMRAGVAGVMTWWVAQDGCKYSDEEVTDFVPDEPRPLPGWRKIRDALREGTAAAYPGSVEKPWSDIDETTLHHYDQMATAIEALLRGESR